MRLKIYRPTADQFEFVVVGESSFESISPGILNSFPTRVPARAGDVLGFSVTAGSNGCVFSSVNIGDVYQGASGDPPVGSSARLTGPSGGVRLNISAVLEPDADRDGFGDESQDACPAEAGPDDGCDPPETSITSGPKEKTRRKRARFEFTSDEPGSSFQCAVDEQALKAPCTSPYAVKVKKGKHTFQVRATDPAGGVDATPASDTWKVKKKKKKKKK
jgi:hypothetical protein